MKHKCRYCDYESAYKANVRRHEYKKHGEPAQPPTSFMQSYPQPQSVHHEQVIQQQQPIYQREIPPPPHTQISPQQNDKTEIERLWKKQLNGIALLKDAQIDSKETDSEDEDDDSLDTVIKNKDEIEKIVEEFDERGNNYFKHCNKEKIETICNWCNELLNKESELFKDKANLNKVKKVLRPVGRKVEKLANSEYPISKQRKLLQEVQVGNGIMGALKTVVLPFLTKLVRNFV